MRTQVLLLSLAYCAAAAAQHSHGYVFFAPGKVTASGPSGGTIHIGGGGEAILGKGVGIGAEIGAIGPYQGFSEALGIGSLNGSFHFIRKSDARIDPFAAAGYTFMVRSGWVNLYNFGGGVNFWFSRRLGLKLEFRDHVYPDYRNYHFLGLRIGLAFRSGG